MPEDVEITVNADTEPDSPNVGDEYNEMIRGTWEWYECILPGGLRGEQDAPSSWYEKNLASQGKPMHRKILRTIA
jgi:hypothetical protein